ncbi:MAG: hypothetical protein SVS15_04115 [Thermodesulfobacteriota bacterium]|nr:hypothetical protein [Thermodesulfobacteriota bacterium]
MRRIAFFFFLGLILIYAAGQASGLATQSLEPVTVRPVTISPLAPAEVTLEPAALTPTGSGAPVGMTLDFNATLTDGTPVDLEGGATPVHSRASTASFYNSTSGYIQNATANVPRFSPAYWIDGVAGGSGLILEPASTNIIPSSDFLAAGFWDSNVNLTGFSAAIESPTGQTDAYGIISNAVNGEHYIGHDASLSNGASENATMYCFAKPGNKDWIYLYRQWRTVASVVISIDWAYFNITTGTIGTCSADVSPFLVSGFNNGFVLVGMSRLTPPNTGQARYFRIHSADSDGDKTFAGDAATVNTYVWGATYERSMPTSLIQTEGATGTRATENAELAGPNGLWWAGGNIASATNWAWTVKAENAGGQMTWNVATNAFTVNGSVAGSVDCGAWPVKGAADEIGLAVGNQSVQITNFYGWH